MYPQELVLPPEYIRVYMTTDKTLSWQKCVEKHVEKCLNDLNIHWKDLMECYDVSDFDYNAASTPTKEEVDIEPEEKIADYFATDFLVCNVTKLKRQVWNGMLPVLATSEKIHEFKNKISSAMLLLNKAMPTLNAGNGYEYWMHNWCKETLEVFQLDVLVPDVLKIVLQYAPPQHNE